MNAFRTSIAAFTFLGCALACGSAVAAQETDPADEPERWAGEIGFALNSTGGNQHITILSTNVALSHLETSEYEAGIGGRFRYGRSGGEDVAQNLQGNVNLDFRPEATWSPFLFATGESDPFKKLEARLNTGAGVKHTFWREDWSEVSLSGAVLYSYENLAVADSLAASLNDGVSNMARWSFRGRTRKEFGEGRRLEQVVFYQPDWDELDDYLLESVTAGRWVLTRGLAFTTTFTYQRDSTPAPDVQPDDWSLAVGLSVATRW